MEPRELDQYIGDKLKEAGNSFPEEGMDSGMKRVWPAIEFQLESRTSFQWMKIAAIILLLLMPSVYLYFINREQSKQITDLNSKLTIIERRYRQKLQAFAANQPEKVIVQHDTIRTVERKIIPKTVEIVKYVTDTIIIYQQSDRTGNLAESEPVVPVNDEFSTTWQESPVKTEYILSKEASSSKKKKNRSFQISLGEGNHSPQTETDLAFKTKL